MHNGGSIGHYCCRKGCPVADDALLWTPERIKKWKASQGEQVNCKGDIKLDSPEGGNPSRVNHRPCKDARNPGSFCDNCYHNKEAHTFGNCAYCNCKGFEKKKKANL